MNLDQPHTEPAGQANERTDDAAARASRFGRLPDRVPPSDYVESQAEDPQPSVPPPAGDPDTAWMLRYSA